MPTSILLSTADIGKVLSTDYPGDLLKKEQLLSPHTPILENIFPELEVLGLSILFHKLLHSPDVVEFELSPESGHLMVDFGDDNFLKLDVRTKVISEFIRTSLQFTSETVMPESRSIYGEVLFRTCLKDVKICFACEMGEVHPADGPGEGKQLVELSAWRFWVEDPNAPKRSESDEQHQPFATEEQIFDYANELKAVLCEDSMHVTHYESCFINEKGRQINFHGLKKEALEEFLEVIENFDSKQDLATNLIYFFQDEEKEVFGVNIIFKN